MATPTWDNLRKYVYRWNAFWTLLLGIVLFVDGAVNNDFKWPTWPPQFTRNVSAITIPGGIFAIVNAILLYKYPNPDSCVGSRVCSIYLLIFHYLPCIFIWGVIYSEWKYNKGIVRIALILAGLPLFFPFLDGLHSLWIRELIYDKRKEN